ncbi:putative protein phosphatase 2C [Trifolium repens]|nr:putative protein phosphatase 2C [Trifolium repens]
MVTYGGMSKKPGTASTSAFIFKLTINSGGVSSFALFNVHGSDDASLKEAAAVIKLSSSRMATQSECLGYEFAKWLGVQTPQARVIHNTSSEWLQIKEAAEKARDAASFERDAIGETTCSELLEALELSRCLLFMRMDEMMRGQRGWRELSILGDKMNMFSGMIEGLIWSPQSNNGISRADDWAFEEVEVRKIIYCSVFTEVTEGMNSYGVTRHPHEE